MSHKSIVSQMRDLETEIKYHQWLYYVRIQPTISDFEFDNMIASLTKMELAYPKYKSSTSPTEIPGSDIEETYAEFLEQFQEMAGLTEIFEKRKKNSKKKCIEGHLEYLQKRRLSLIHDIEVIDAIINSYKEKQ